MTEDHQRHGFEYARGEAGDRFQDDRVPINRARQAAEALFAPKQPIGIPAAPALTPSGDGEVRKPRILKAQPMLCAASELTAAEVTHERPPTDRIAAAHAARIRTWLRYGMTIHQVAQVYGVAAGDIRRVLRMA
jgi:hypothetical protein